MGSSIVLQHQLTCIQLYLREPAFKSPDQFLACIRRIEVSANYYLRRYLDATDAGEKLIWAFKGRLSQIELDAGQLMLEDYRRTSRRYAMIPVAFIALELVKTSRSRSYLRTSGRISRLLLGVTICTYSTFANQVAVIEQHDLNKNY